MRPLHPSSPRHDARRSATVSVAHLQKDELESQCAAMIEQGIVRPSTSPFSAVVLLVKEPDGTWRFCVDYRALNERTVKDRFLIRVVDELIDELC
jgi:formylmethanofuran:tetrahydromethanopterin formyltransferase